MAATRGVDMAGILFSLRLEIFLLFWRKDRGIICHAVSIIAQASPPRNPAGTASGMGRGGFGRGPSAREAAVEHFKALTHEYEKGVCCAPAPSPPEG